MAQETTKAHRMKKRISPKMETAVAIFEDKIKGRKPYKIKEVLRQAGYSETTVQQSTKVMKHIRPKLADIVDQMERIRARALERMEDTIEHAFHDDLRKTVDSLTNSIQLLSGGPTANVAMIIDDKKREQADRALDQFLGSDQGASA